MAAIASQESVDGDCGKIGLNQTPIRAHLRCREVIRGILSMAVGSVTGYSQNWPISESDMISPWKKLRILIAKIFEKKGNTANEFKKRLDNHRRQQREMEDELNKAKDRQENFAYDKIKEIKNRYRKNLEQEKKDFDRNRGKYGEIIPKELKIFQTATKILLIL